MDEKLMNALSDKIGVKLTVRDSHKLERETLEKTVDRMIKPFAPSKASEVMDMSEAMERFYSRGNKKD